MIFEVAPWTESRRLQSLEFISDFEKLDIESRFIFGNNVYTKALLHHLEVHAVIVDDPDLASSNDELIKFVTLDQVPMNSMVIIASGGRILQAVSKLHSSGMKYLDYFAFREFSNYDLPETVFNEGFAQEFNHNHDKFQDVYRLVSDDISRHLLDKLWSFRINSDISALEGLQDNEKNQYFESFVPLNTPVRTFLDIGGFDGYTTEEFLRRSGQNSRSIIFEPEGHNYTTCKEKFSNCPNVTIHNIGAGSVKSELRFSSNGSGSSINEHGNSIIQIEKIDDVVSEPVSYIKMDIEGFEMEALIGATETIRLNKPILAICVYHKPNDFWQIPNFILEINPNYQVFVRHYTESIYETVMYFVPKQDQNG